MKGCISSVFFSIMINGRPRGKFASSRGLRQGDFLSLFLFTLATDGLGRLVDLAINRDLVNGF